MKEEDKKLHDEMLRKINTLREVGGDKLVDDVIKNNTLAFELFAGMKDDFDKNIPVEESLMKIVREHGIKAALAAGSLWVHWFVTDRAPQALGRADN